MDVKGSGYDSGHLAPAGDASSPNAMAQSFALSNMVPQDRVNNQKVWNKLEKDTRKYVIRPAGDVFVFTGPILDANHATVGRNNVLSPTRLFKLVYDQTSKRAWAQVLPNSPAARLSKPMSCPEFVQQTGWRLLDGLDIRQFVLAPVGTRSTLEDSQISLLNTKLTVCFGPGPDVRH